MWSFQCKFLHLFAVLFGKEFCTVYMYFIVLARSLLPSWDPLCHGVSLSSGYVLSWRGCPGWSGLYTMSWRVLLWWVRPNHVHQDMPGWVRNCRYFQQPFWISKNGNELHSHRRLWGRLKWHYAITRLTVHFCVWPDVWSGDCKFWKVWSYMTPNVLAETRCQ